MSDFDPYDPDDDDDTITIEIEHEADESFGVTTPDDNKPDLNPAVVRLVRQNRMLSVSSIMALPPIEWFIEGVLPAGPVTVMHGIGGTRKSFIMLDWALCADQHLAWHGHWVRPGKTLYIAGEGVQGLGKRIRAWCTHHDIEPGDLRTDFMAIPLNLFTLKPEQVDNWAALVAHLGYDYIVVDTMHTAAAGADENSSQDIGLVYSNARRIAGDGQLFFIHHDPKQGKSARGSTAIRDDADVVITVEKDTLLQLTSVIKPDKIRDADDFRPIHAHFEQVGEGLASSLFIKSIGHDEDPSDSIGQGQRIINILTDQPGRTKNEVLTLLGTKNDRKFKALADAGSIYSKRGPHQEGSKTIERDLWYAEGYVDTSIEEEE